MPHPSTCVNYLNHPHARRLPAGCPHARKSNPTAARNAVFRKSEGQRSLSNRNQWASTLSELAGSVTRCCRSKSEPSKHYIPTDSVTRCCRSKSEPSKHYIPTDSSQRSALHIHYIYIYHGWMFSSIFAKSIDPSTSPIAKRWCRTVEPRNQYTDYMFQDTAQELMWRVLRRNGMLETHSFVQKLS